MDSMVSRKEKVERRKHQRFQVQDGAFAVLTPDFCNWSQIIDISRGGLAFCYTGLEQLPNASFALGISLADFGFYLGKVPFKAIWDFEIANEDACSFTTIRRCGVEFGKLTPSQLFQLEYFIEDYALAEALA
jgi:hypothetical protein